MFARILQTLRSSRVGARRDNVTAPHQIVAWWEIRRLVFNACVGSSGVVSLLLVAAAALLSEILIGESFIVPDPPLFVLIPVVLYAIAANVLYTGGWVAELLVQRAWPSEASKFGTTAFAVGLVTSILLTMLPGVLFGLVIVIHLALVLAGWLTR